MWCAYPFASARSQSSWTSDPLPGTPAHTVLMHEAFADHQVANITTEVEARTIGASIAWPALAPGRHTA
jgi:hypothetical protein